MAEHISQQSNVFASLDKILCIEVPKSIGVNEVGIQAIFLCSYLVLMPDIIFVKGLPISAHPDITGH